jgi:hypothetical protein
MWQKLYSTSSLLFLAGLAIGIWGSYLFTPPPLPPCNPVAEAQSASPTPTRRSAEEILGITPNPTPRPKYADFEAVTGVPAGATAQCRDGTYSYSANRRGTCSHHGGVLRWIPN